MPFADHNAILDPTCSDLTARTLELLGYIGYNPGRPLVRKAIRYLRKTQEDDGSWYGRWGVNYIYGTWQVLRGLRAIGEDMAAELDPARARLAGELSERRRRLGETCASYENPDLKGKGREHGFANGLGVDGNLRLRRSRSAERAARSALTPLARSGPTAPGTNRRSPAPDSRASSI